ncbi:hypothetical protein AR687_19905 [Flavobacteriaceae bacterium CRH]|nr:hypothetical protein AR687_19905 [Flavobacteriaceae bacterium CRH]
MEMILAYVDLLGFTKMIEKNQKKSEEILLQFYDIAFASINNDERLKGNISSDCLLVYSESYPALINCLTEIYRSCFLWNDSFTDPDFYLLPRGAVSIGEMTIGERDTSMTITKDFMIGKALVHSSKLEPLIKGSRLVVAVHNTDEQQEKALLHNKEICSLLYQNCTFKFWKDYSYVDALWFLDLNKSFPEQKKQVVQLLDIAIRLAVKNVKNKKVLDHYINTLRIGLLSYAPFVDNEEDIIIKTIIKDFRSGHYWLIWLTVIEILLNNQNKKSYSAWKSLQSFYKKVSLEKSWIYILEEINKPEKAYLKKDIQKFVHKINL